MVPQTSSDNNLIANLQTFRTVYGAVGLKAADDSALEMVPGIDITALRNALENID